MFRAYGSFPTALQSNSSTTSLSPTSSSTSSSASSTSSVCSLAASQKSTVDDIAAEIDAQQFIESLLPTSNDPTANSYATLSSLSSSLAPLTQLSLNSYSNNNTNNNGGNDCDSTPPWSCDSLPQLLNDFNQLFISNVSNLNGMASNTNFHSNNNSMIFDETINASIPYNQTNTPASQYPIGSSRRRKPNEVHGEYFQRNGGRNYGVRKNGRLFDFLI